MARRDVDDEPLHEAVAHPLKLGRQNFGVRGRREGLAGVKLVKAGDEEGIEILPQRRLDFAGRDGLTPSATRSLPSGGALRRPVGVVPLSRIARRETGVFRRPMRETKSAAAILSRVFVVGEGGRPKAEGARAGAHGDGCERRRTSSATTMASGLRLRSAAPRAERPGSSR